MLIAILTAAAMLTSDSAPQQFDLLCTGLQDFSKRRPEAKDDIRFRVDLKNRRYCLSTCRDTRVLNVYPQHLAFDETDAMLGGSRLQTRMSVDRMTGAYTSIAYMSGRLMEDTKGQCSVQPYTGPVLGERLF
ncbi:MULTISPECIES: hypothetical protein [unclassified Brevundimonas]|uniref:hypothetical protein n=1 Tax=unclassified Brevundimonas TaxID=2622653 RepID=UPI0025BD6E76|nr:MULTISPECIES: hypothetical protein [unclassified Brevundimonas]